LSGLGNNSTEFLLSSQSALNATSTVHCVQDKEHVLLDCPSADLANPRIKHHHLVYNPSSSLNWLRDFTSQPDTKGLALSVHACIECYA